jgi:hypothetical protein
MKSIISLLVGIVVFCLLIFGVLGNLIAWFAGLWGLAAGPTTAIKVICWIICLPTSGLVSFYISILVTGIFRAILGDK